MAEQEVTKFHEMFNANEFEIIYANSSKHLKEHTNEKDFVAMLSSLNSELGVVKRSEQTGWSIESNTSNGTLITLKYHTTYESGVGDEEFIYEIRSRRVALGHFIVHYTKFVQPESDK